MNEGRIYLAVIGDIKKSRDLKNRNEIQKKIKDVKLTENSSSMELVYDF